MNCHSNMAPQSKIVNQIQPMSGYSLQPTAHSLLLLLGISIRIRSDQAAG